MGFSPGTAGRGQTAGFCVFLLAGLVCGIPDVAAYDQGGVSREYQLKAVFLFRFAQFVEWPNDAFAGPDAPMVIGVFGHDPFGSLLEQVVKGEKARNRVLITRRYQQPAEMADCHILFVPAPDDARLPELLEQVRGRPVLTVGETKDFPERGGMIQFVITGDKIRLRVNLEAVRAARLEVSSKLLMWAEIVGSKDAGKK